ncbi:MAG: TonB-dependent receptor, partial [Acidobacteriia bacterium]|nr:TonB-dependent receptor [Terriglobia bacterium]
QDTRIRTAGGSVQNLGFGPTFAIPTPAERGGDFSGLANALYDPTTTVCTSGCAPGSLSALPGQSPVYSRTPYANNKIPVSEMDPVAMKLAALYPSPNTALANCGGAAGGSGCYAVATPGALNTDQGDGRVDWRYNDANSIFGTISWSNTAKSSVPPFPGALDGGNFQGSSEQDLGRNAMLSWTHTFSPTMVNEARVGFSRLVTARTQANANTDIYKELGIGGYDPTTTLNGGAPQIDLGRYNQIGANNWLPTKEYNNEWDMIENLSIVHGNHQFRMGGEFRALHFPFFQVPYPHGEMSFGLTETGAQNPATGNLLAGTGDEFASFLLGSVDGTAQISTTNFISSTKQAYATYFMDNWKITPKLTLNLGVRYELFSPIGEQFGRQSNFDFANLTLDIPKGPNQNAPLPPNFNSPAVINGVTFPALFTTPITVSRGKVSPYLIPWDKADIGPRLGFAYNIEPKTVIRGFFGMFYGGEENQGGNPNRGESAPFNESPSLAPPSGVSTFQPDPLMANGSYTGALSVGFPVNVFNGFPVTSLQFREVYPDFLNPLVQEWNLAVQHQFPGQMALEVGYEGNHQAHQLYQPDPNACPTVINTNSSLNCNNFRPHPDIGSVSGTATFGIGNYEAMTASLTKRLSSGLQGQVSYTYGHALSDTGTTLSGSPGFFVLNGTNIKTSYSSAPWDIRHAVVGSFNYEIPFGRGKQYGANLNKVVQTLAGNWQLNGILTLRTGQPFTLNSGGGACGGIIAEGFTAYANGNCMPTMIPGRTNPNQAPPGGRSPNKWFNTANFVPISQLTLSELETQGNTGLNSNVGPPQRSLDFSVFKDFDFTERWKLEFRAEGTNVANTPQYSVSCVSLNQNSGNFGQITCTNAGSERHIDFQLRLMF